MTTFRIHEGAEEDGDCCVCTGATCGQVCLTGCMGCTWRERGKRSSSWCDIFWFALLTFTFVVSLVWIHYYVAVHNIAFDIECYLNSFLNYTQWIYWYLIGIGITALVCTYLFVLMMMSLVHASLHLPIYISHLHRCLIILCLLLIGGGVAGLILFDGNSIHLLALMLEFTAPFLHIGVVLVMTVITYLIAGKWLRIKSFGWQTTTIIIYVLVMLAIFLCPLIIPRSLIVERSDIPKRPELIAHRGASSVMPENTIAAMNRAKLLAIYGTTMDVWLSYDGIPFLHRDNTMRRTTDVSRLFPDLHHVTTPYWNSSQLETLNAGNWFLEANPFLSSPSLPERTIINVQKIPFLAATLNNLDNMTSILVEIHEPGENFKHEDGYLEKILTVLNDSQIDNDKIFLLDDISSPRINRDYQFRLLSPSPASEQLLTDGNYTGIYTDTGAVSRDTARSLRHFGLMTVGKSVNCAWLYSMLWLREVDMVVTKFPQDLARLSEPSYTIDPTSYLIIWTTIDGVSILGVLLMWGVQIIRYQRSNDPIESMPLDNMVFTLTSSNTRPTINVWDDNAEEPRAENLDIDTEFLSI